MLKKEKSSFSLSRWQSFRYHLSRQKTSLFLSFFGFGILAASFAWIGYSWQQQQRLVQEQQALQVSVQAREETISSLQQEIKRLQNEDQTLRNNRLEEQLELLEKTATAVIKEYERLIEIQKKNASTDEIEKQWASVLASIADRDYATASATLEKFRSGLTALEAKLIAVPNLANVPVNNQAPPSGYQRQQVETEIGTYVVSLVAGDLSTTRVIVDTASAGDCANDCPVLPLGDYVSRNGAYAGINGTYFCPASYPSCAGKTNSFDLLVMNKDKTYFNSANNVYSTNPAVIFSDGGVRFVSAASQWGRDTSVTAVISNFPLLLQGGEIRFAGDGDPKKGSKGSRSFVANKGNTAYIGVVHNATVAEAAWALKGLGMENAMNLDSGGSTALWAGGYKVGPGRNIPNALLFVRK